MAKDSASDEIPGPGRPVSSAEAGSNQGISLSPEREVLLFEQVRVGTAARERLTERVNTALCRHVANCGQLQLATEEVQEAIKGCVRSAIARQSLLPTGHIEFCESLGKGIRSRIEELLNDRDDELDGGITDWIERVCDERAIQAAVGDDLWEMENEWEKLAQRERAIQEVIACHLPLAKTIAKTNKRKPGEFDDLLQEATLILHRLMENFDPSVGVRFCGYAKTVLLRDLRRQYEATLGLTRYSSDQAKAVDSVEYELIQQRGRPVTADEVYQLLGHSPETRREVENVRRLLLAERSSSSRDPQLQQSLVVPDWSEKLSDEEHEFRQRILLPAFRSLPGLEKRLVIGIAICGQSVRNLAKRYHRNHATITRLYQAALKLLAERIGPHWLPQKPR